MQSSLPSIAIWQLFLVIAWLSLVQERSAQPERQQRDRDARRYAVR